MAEYIERQAAIDAAMQYCPDDDGTCSKADKDIRELLDELEDIPVADVKPVVHSRWIKYTGMGKVQWMCEKCSAEEKNPKVANYCYHCGAKMDGGES